MADLTDEKSALDDVFSKGSDMGADTAAPGADVKAEAPPAEKPEPKPEQVAKAEEVKDDEAQPQGRDPQTGRFVPVTELVAERKKLKGERDAEAKLRMEAEANAKAYREQVEFLQRQAQSQQRTVQQQPEPQQQPVPDPILDPEGFANYQNQIIEARLLNIHVNTSERFARMQHGDEKVNAALKAAHERGIASNFMRAADPFEALMKWHRKSMMDAEIGDDLEAYKKRIEEQAVQKALANLKATGQPQAQAQPQRFPTTLADQTAQGDQGAVLTEEAAINDVFARKRRV